MRSTDQPSTSALRKGRGEFVVAAVGALCALCFAPATAMAQLGAGWVPTNFTKSVHLDDEARLQTFSWAASRSVCTPACADYAYQSATDTETFRIFDSRSNRSEIRLQNNYSSGVWQFEGYVKFDAPLHDESLFQIFGNTGSAATFLMMRGYRDNGGTIRVMGGSNTIATDVYGDEVRINVIHQYNVSAKFYVNGQFIYEKPHNDPGVTNYWKYGVYGTTNGNVPAIVQWRGVRTFRDGLPPEANATPVGAYESEAALLSGPIIASNQPGYTGTGFADFVNNSGDYVQWNFDAPKAGIYDLNFRYALQSGSRPLSIQVDGETVNDLMDFPQTGSFQNWAYSTIRSVYLTPGRHSVRATTVGFNGANIDHLLVEAGWAADLDRNGIVTAADWNLFKSGQGANMSSMSLEQTYFLGDLNGDRQHDLFDFFEFRKSYEEANGGGSFATMLAVPEPTTLVLTTCALLGFALRRRR
jgi:hypothetical protein